MVGIWITGSTGLIHLAATQFRWEGHKLYCMRATKQEGRGGEIPGAETVEQKHTGMACPGEYQPKWMEEGVTLQTSTIFVKMVINSARKLSA